MNSGLCACGDHGFISLTKGQVALVDPSDFADLSQIKWYANICGRQIYARNDKNGYLHRIVVGARPNELADHINRDSLDCRKHNLRVAGRRLNACNSRDRKSKSGRRHIYYDKRTETWYAQWGPREQRKTITGFATVADAFNAYLRWRGGQEEKRDA